MMSTVSGALHSAFILATLTLDLRSVCVNHGTAFPIPLPDDSGSTGHLGGPLGDPRLPLAEQWPTVPGGRIRYSTPTPEEHNDPLHGLVSRGSPSEGSVSGWMLPTNPKSMRVSSHGEAGSCLAEFSAFAAK